MMISYCIIFDMSYFWLSNWNDWKSELFFSFWKNCRVCVIKFQPRTRMYRKYSITVFCYVIGTLLYIEHFDVSYWLVIFKVVILFQDESSFFKLIAQSNAYVANLTRVLVEFIYKKKEKKVEVKSKWIFFCEFGSSFRTQLLDRYRSNVK